MNPKTLIVFGNFRGGTSMVAHCLKNMGVFMGYDIGEGNGEDKDFQFAEPRQIIELIKKRNAEHDVWGWKFPDSINYVDRFKSHLVNPHYICIFRDPYAVALSEEKRTGQDFNTMFARANQRNAKMIEFSRNCEGKVLRLSYEHCITRLDEFAKTLTEYVGIGDKKDVIDIVDPYLKGGDYGKSKFTYS